MHNFASIPIVLLLMSAPFSFLNEQMTSPAVQDTSLVQSLESEQQKEFRDSLIDALSTELQRLRQEKFRDSLAAQTELEISPTAGIRVKGFPLWVVLIFAAAALLLIGFTIWSRSQNRETAETSFGIFSLILVGVAAFLLGNWWARDTIDQDLSEVLSTLQVQPVNINAEEDSTIAEYVITMPLDTLKAELSKLSLELSKQSQKESLITRTMMWFIVIGSLIILFLILGNLFMYLSLQLRYGPRENDDRF